MTIKTHKVLNSIFYIIILGWGEWEIIQICKQQYFILFIISFVYSTLINIIYKVLKYFIDN